RPADLLAVLEPVDTDRHGCAWCAAVIAVLPCCRSRRSFARRYRVSIFGLFGFEPPERLQDHLFGHRAARRPMVGVVEHVVVDVGFAAGGFRVAAAVDLSGDFVTALESLGAADRGATGGFD